MEKKEMKKGQKVWLVPTGNMLRRGDKEPIEGVVKSVGNKYIHIEHMNRISVFYCDTLIQKTMYAPDYILYTDLDQYRIEKELKKMVSDIRGVFSGYGMPNLPEEKIRSIHSLIITP